MPRNKHQLEMVRMNIEVPVKIKEKVSELAIQLNALSMTEVIIRSVSLLHAVKRAGESGDEIIIRSANGKEKTIVVE